MAEQQPWEALDLDDSDLPSLLRPCRRRLGTSSSAAAPSDCRPSQSEEENLIQLPAHHSLDRRTIPGPAGVVQAAMFRKNQDRQNRIVASYRDSEEDINGDDRVNNDICTQEYIQRAVETADFDEEFTLQPWVSALKYIGLNSGTLQSTPINCLKKCLNAGKAALVVAVIKSCTPNGLGGLLVLLKDPTGTVGASVHHKVLRTEFGKRLTIGTVVILHEVAVFAPERSVYYLNITQRNLVKVFRQNDAASSVGIDNTIASIQYAVPLIAGEKTTPTPITQSTVKEASAERFIPGNLPNSSIAAGVKSHLVSTQEEITKETTPPGSPGSTKNRDVDCTSHMVGEECIPKSIDEQIHRKTKPSLPQWTDEQLDELFAGEDDNLFL